MKTLRQLVEETAFWEGRICLHCDEQIDDPDLTACPDCDRPALVSAASLTRWLARVEEDDE